MGVSARCLCFRILPPNPPPSSLNAVGFWNAVPNNLSVACVLVSLFVFVLSNVCGWKKGNDIHFFENAFSAFIISCPNYIISISAGNCFIRIYVLNKGGLQSGNENGPWPFHLPTRESLSLPSEV